MTTTTTTIVCFLAHCLTPNARDDRHLQAEDYEHHEPRTAHHCHCTTATHRVPVVIRRFAPASHRDICGRIGRGSRVLVLLGCIRQSRLCAPGPQPVGLYCLHRTYCAYRMLVRMTTTMGTATSDAESGWDVGRGVCAPGTRWRGGRSLERAPCVPLTEAHVQGRHYDRDRQARRPCYAPLGAPRHVLSFITHTVYSVARFSLLCSELDCISFPRIVVCSRHIPYSDSTSPTFRFRHTASLFLVPVPVPWSLLTLISLIP